MKNASASSPAAMRSDALDATTNVSPRFAYHTMDVVVVEHDEPVESHRRQRMSAQQLSNRSSLNNNKTEREKRFACQFDPSLKNGRSLVRLLGRHAVLF